MPCGEKADVCRKGEIEGVFQKIGMLLLFLLQKSKMQGGAMWYDIKNRFYKLICNLFGYSAAYRRNRKNLYAQPCFIIGTEG